MEPAALQALADHQAIVDTIVRWASALDAKDWGAARACFTDEVETDYADLRGTGAERLSADAFVELRRTALERLTTHHMSTNHVVTLDGDRATCASAMLIHRLDPGIIPFRKATECQIHVSGGEFNTAANLSDCFGLKTGVATAISSMCFRRPGATRSHSSWPK